MSIIYEATCGTCSNKLTVSKAALDNDGDLIIEVELCEYCLDEKDCEISDLKGEIEELETRLDEKNGEIADLEAKIEELE